MEKVLASSKSESKLQLIAYALLGSAWLAATAQISLPLPFTPVPITGQTFGVMLLSLTLGRKAAFASFAAYFAEAALGLPVFANGSNLAMVGPTLGYLIGMLLAAYIVGALSDLGARKSFILAFLSCYVGSACIFGCGLLVLRLYVPTESLLAAGFIPFLFGDFLKNILAAYFATRPRWK